ncbi:MAG TPA: GNAT family N-acetyltransferase [Xanthobacteraceae bacterium]
MSPDGNPLDRPPWSALTTSHAAFAVGNDLARRYRPEFSPLSAVREVSAPCLQPLSALMQPGDIVGLFGDEPITPVGDLVEVVHRPLEQFVYDQRDVSAGDVEFFELSEADAPKMMALAKLTEPGPFEARTVALGEYLGVRSGGQLIAMAGERMKFPGFTEISAVCTHPEHRGRGLAEALVRTLMRNILARGEAPFLHIFRDNAAARALYVKLGLKHRRSLVVSVLKRADPSS